MKYTKLRLNLELGLIQTDKLIEYGLANFVFWIGVDEIWLTYYCFHNEILANLILILNNRPTSKQKQL